MALRIRIEHGQDAGTTWRLGAPGVYRFGRSPHGSVQVLDMKVSKEHFEIYVGAQNASLRDLGSTHGTLLNQQKAPADLKPISPGDEIRAGLTVLRVLSDGDHDQEAKPVGPLPAGEPAPSAMPSSGIHTAASPARTAMPSAGSPDPLVGTALAGYRLLERVGAGGMGSVYRAEQLSLHREVALKVLSEKLVSDSAFVDQFVNEARAAGQLNHPNVVQVYDVGQADSRHFFSMEFIHGGSLESKIPRTGGGVPWNEALNWFLDAANALIFAEKKGILHRDIKPDNFMLGQDGSVKLCDLGLAKKSESADLLAQGIIGTPHFISPESIRRKTEVDGRADLYSLGCTFFRIFTGRNPYPAPSVKDILLAHLNAPVPRVSSVVADFPKDLDEVVFRLMQKDPAQRFQTAEELWEALDKIRLQYGMEAHGLHPGRAKKFAIAGILVAVAAVGALVWFIWFKPRETIRETDTVFVQDPEQEAKDRAMRETNASLALSNLTNEVLSKLGLLEAGENWRKEAWESYAQRYVDLATKHPETEAAGEATKEAERIRNFRTAQKGKSDALAAATQRAVGALEVASMDGLKRARAAATPLEAEKAIDEGIAAVREAGKAAHEGRALVSEDAVRDQLAPFTVLRGEIAEKVRTEFQTLDADAKKKAKAATAEALAAAAGLYETYANEHAPAQGDGAIATAWNDARRSAENAGRALRGEQAKALTADFRRDSSEYFRWLRAAYEPGTGHYAAFRFGDVATSADAAAEKARTVEYRRLFKARAAEARLADRLRGALSKWFAEKGFKDRLKGTGWDGTPKGFTPVGVEVGDKVRPYTDEGLGWFLDLFFDKGQERYPLDADGWEGIAVLAEAATVQEGAARSEQAAKAFEQAAKLDPKRAARLAPRIEEAKAEREVRALLEESDELVRSATAAMATHESEIAVADMKKSAEARKRALEAEPKLRSDLERARALLFDAESKYPDTIGRALISEPGAPPPAATYAGEPLPPTPPPAPPPAPAPAPAAPAPGMDGATDGSAMDDGGSKEGAKDGAAMGGG